jgi:hypothetical protein
VERGGAIPGTPKTPDPRRERRTPKDEGRYTCPSETTANTKPPSHSAKVRGNFQHARAYKRFSVHRQRKYQNSQYHATCRSDSLCVVTRVFPGTKHLIVQSHSAGQRAHHYGHAGQRALCLLHASRPRRATSSMIRSVCASSWQSGPARIILGMPAFALW